MDIVAEHPPLPSPPRSVATDISAVEVSCRDRGLKFTRNRRLVLECLLQSDRPLGAYDLLRRLETRLGRQLSPPTVYRALDFLLKESFISRLATRSAFIPSIHPRQECDHVFFLCEHCGTSAKIRNSDLETLFERDALALGFRIGRRIIELQGVCAECLAVEE